MFPKAQQGFLMPLALMLVVGISVLAIAVSRLSGQSTTSITLEEMSARAFYAAESGGQLAVGYLYLNASDRAQTDQHCNDLNGFPVINLFPSGLTGCRTRFSCSASANPANTASFYTISSQGVCGSGDFTAERNIQVTTVMR